MTSRQQPDWDEPCFVISVVSRMVGVNAQTLRYYERIELLDQATIDDDDALDQYIWGTAAQIFHPVGTAKMGPASDPEAVVDAHGRVHGIDGLRVVDASIMPNIVRANTNLTCIMMGERVADWIKAGE